jgi:hypothetical protein
MQLGLIDFVSKNGSANVTYKLATYISTCVNITQVGTQVGTQVVTRLLHTKDKHKHKQSKELSTSLRSADNYHDEDVREEKKSEVDKIDYLKFIQTYNEVVNGYLPKARITNSAIPEHRKTAIRSLLKQVTYAEFGEALQRAIHSDFCCGRNKTQWTATFDWLVNPKNALKVLEGKYDGREVSNQTYQEQLRRNELAEQIYTTQREFIQKQNNAEGCNPF